MNRKMQYKSSLASTILGFVIILILIGVAIFSIIILGSFFLNLLERMSKIDAVVIVALITGALSLITNVISKAIEYRNSRKEYLAQKREKSYEDFISMVYKFLENTKKPNNYNEEEMISDIKEFSESLTLWGSKKVAEKWVKFRLRGENSNPDINVLYDLEDIMNEMRTDMGVKKLKKDTLLSFFVNDLNQNKS